MIERREKNTNEPVFDPKADSPLSDDALKAKKERYAHFDVESNVACITQESLGVAVERIEPLGVGANAFDHLVYRLHTTDGRVLVCRINTDSLVAEHFPIETALYDAWRAAGIPSPEVYGVALRNIADGLDYMLLENVGTSDLEKHLVQHPEDTIEYARTSGAFLARLHTVPVPGFGMLTLREDSLQGSQVTWREFLHTRLDETLAYVAHHHLLSEEQIEEVRSTMIRNDALLDLDQGVTLHGDYHNANIIIDEERKEVVAAVDLTQAKAGDPIFDLAFYSTYVSPETFTTFCEGYFPAGDRPDDFEKKLALYQLRIQLSKIKLRKRFGYEARIPLAVEGVMRALQTLL